MTTDHKSLTSRSLLIFGALLSATAFLSFSADHHSVFRLLGAVDAGESRNAPPVPLGNSGGFWTPTAMTTGDEEKDQTDEMNPVAKDSAAKEMGAASGTSEANPSSETEIPVGQEIGAPSTPALIPTSAPVSPESSDYQSTDSLVVSPGPEEEITVTRKTAYPRETVLYEFSNGLTLFVQRNLTGLATVRAYVRNTGSQNEREFLGSGISHLTEHIVCGGTTPHRNRAETQTMLDRLGGSFNAFTGKEITGYYIDCASDGVTTAMDLMADWMRDCEINADDFTREKRVILQELTDGQNDPDRVASELLLQTVYRENPYRHPVGGYPDRFVQLTRDDVKRFYQTRYVPNQTVFLVAGDVKPDAIAQKLAELYRGTPRGPETEPASPTEPTQIAPREAVREMDGEMFRLLLAWPTVALHEADAPILDVLAVILAGGESGRLNRKIKNEKQLGFAFDASSATPAGVPGFFLIESETMPESLEAVQTEILDQIQRLAEVPVTQEELARAKKQTEAAFVYGRETLSAVADSCILNYLMTGDPDFDRQYLEKIRKVSAGDLTRVVQTYFRPERRNRILIAPIGMTPSDVLPAVAQPPVAISAFQIPENGLRILVKKSDSLPMVNVQVFCLASGLTDTDENAGRSAMLAEMFDKGSENFSRTDIENYFDSVGGSLTFRAGRNTIGADMTVLKEDFPKSLPILAELILHPTFPEEEFTKAKKRQLEKILRRSSDPSAELFELFSSALPTTTPYHLQIDGTAESVERLTIDDLKKLHHQILVPERTIVTVFGDVDPEEAAYLVKDFFSRLPKTQNLPELSFDRKNDFLREPDEHKMTQKGTGMGIIAWPTITIRDQKDYAALTVLQTILGGYGYPGGRLFEELRREGLVYRLTVDQMVGPAPGYFFAFFETAPDKVSDVFDRIEKGVERIKGGDLPEEEFARAKEKIIAFHPRELETLAASAQKAALDDLYGLSYKSDLEFNRRIGDVTREDVIAAAQKFFSQRARVSTSPNPTR